MYVIKQTVVFNFQRINGDSIVIKSKITQFLSPNYAKFGKMNSNVHFVFGTECNKKLHFPVKLSSFIVYVSVLANFFLRFCVITKKNILF